MFSDDPPSAIIDLSFTDVLWVDVWGLALAALGLLAAWRFGRYIDQLEP